MSHAFWLTRGSLAFALLLACSSSTSVEPEGRAGAGGQSGFPCSTCLAQDCAWPANDCTGESGCSVWLSCARDALASYQGQEPESHVNAACSRYSGSQVYKTPVLTCLKGCCGEEPDSGSSGNSGAAGDAGSSGTAGNSGDGGASGGGVSGASGVGGGAGEAGTSGAGGAGQAGASGTAGTSGSSGEAGASGVGGAGQAGASGTAGTAGQAGASGTAGTSGSSGDAGASGAGGAGQAGASGAAGAAGAAGQTQCLSPADSNITWPEWVDCTSGTWCCQECVKGVLDWYDGTANWHLDDWRLNGLPLPANQQSVPADIAVEIAKCERLAEDFFNYQNNGCWVAVRDELGACAEEPTIQLFKRCMFNTAFRDAQTNFKTQCVSYYMQLFPCLMRVCNSQCGSIAYQPCYDCDQCTCERNKYLANGNAVLLDWCNAAGGDCSSYSGGQSVLDDYNDCKDAQCSAECR